MGMSAFLEMGGYGAFVWSSWGIAVLVIVMISVRSILRAKTVTKKLTDLEHDQ